jgi:hypothetical protein
MAMMCRPAFARTDWWTEDLQTGVCKLVHIPDLPETASEMQAYVNNHPGVGVGFEGPSGDPIDVSVQNPPSDDVIYYYPTQGGCQNSRYTKNDIADRSSNPPLSSYHWLPFPTFMPGQKNLASILPTDQVPTPNYAKCSSPDYVEFMKENIVNILGVGPSAAKIILIQVQNAFDLPGESDCDISVYWSNNLVQYDYRFREYTDQYGQDTVSYGQP